MGRHTDPGLAQRRATVLTIVASALLVAGGLLALKLSIDRNLTPPPPPPSPSPSAGAETRGPTRTTNPPASPTTPPTTMPTVQVPTTEEPAPAVALPVGAHTPVEPWSGSSPTQRASASATAPRHRGGGARPPGHVVQDVVGLVNDARADAGCAPVRSDPRLQRAAQDHSIDMATRDYLSHTDPDGRTFAERIRDAGFEGSPLGENLAAGHTSPESVVAAWLGSGPHRAAILNCAYTRIGVGLGTGGTYGYYWTQDLGG